MSQLSSFGKGLSLLLSSLLLAVGFIPLAVEPAEALSTKTSGDCTAQFSNSNFYVSESDGNCWVTFTDSGTFYPGTLQLTEIVAIGGGGGGGSDGGSGGSGAQFRHRTTSAVLTSNISVTVGAAGAGAVHGGANATNGGSSVFGSYVTAVGGQYGHNGSTSRMQPRTGGSGGTAYSGGYGGGGGSTIAFSFAGEDGGNGTSSSAYLGLRTPGGGGGGGNYQGCTSNCVPRADGGYPGGGYGGTYTSTGDIGRISGDLGYGAGGGGGASYTQSNTNASKGGKAGAKGVVRIEYVNSPQVASFTTSEGPLSNSTTQQYQLEFTQDTNGIAGSDFENSGSATGCSFSSSGTGYLAKGSTLTLTVSDCADGTLIPRLKAKSVYLTGYTSSTGPTLDQTGPTITLDREQPTISASSVTTPNNSNPVIINITSDETIIGLAADDLTATGCDATLSGSGSSYQLSLADCAEGDITVSMTGDATDEAGNLAIKPPDITFVADRTFESGSITSPSTPSNNEPLQYSYTPGESLALGSEITTSEIDVSGGSCSLDDSSLVLDGSKYNFEVINCAGGDTAHVFIKAGAISDPAGNQNAQINFNSVVVDKEVKIGIIGEPANTQRNSGTINFTLNFDESVSGLEPDDLSITGTLSGCSITDFPEQNNITSYEVEVSGCEDEASVILTLGQNSVSDALGNLGPISPIQTSAFIVDLTAPVLNSVTPRNTRQNSSTVVYDVVFSEPVKDVSASMFTTSSDGCSAPVLTSAGNTFESDWVLTLSGCNDGVVELAVAVTDAITDGATNQLDPNTASATQSIADMIVDTIAPIASWQTAPTGPLNSQPTFTISFNEAMDANSFLGTDFSNAGNAPGCLFNITAVNSTTFEITTTGCTDGTVQPVIAAGSVKDLAGNDLSSALSLADRTSGSVEIDFTAPSVSFLSEPNNPTNAESFDYQIQFDEPVQGVDVDAFTMDGSVTGCSMVVTPDQSNPTTVFDLEVSGCSEGNAILTVNANSITDIAGNQGPTLAESASNLTIDRTPAVATLSAQTTSPTKDTTIVFEINFDEPISSLVASDFSLTGTDCSLGTLNGNQPGSVFTLSVTGCAVATTAELTLNAETVEDAAGNISPAAISNTASITTDRVPASVIDFSVLQENDNGLVVYNLEFDEPVSDLASADFSASGVTVVTPIGVEEISSTQYEITAQALSSGDMTLTLGAETVIDGPGNLSAAENFPSATETISFDDLAGAITASPSLTEFGKTKESNLSWTVAVSRAISSTPASNLLEAAEISVTSGSCTGISTNNLTATTFEISATCSDGEVVLEIAEDSITDPDGNSWPAETLSTSVVEVDTTVPSVSSTSPVGSGQLVRQVFEFEFSEPVYGITLADFSQTGSASGCSLSFETVSLTEVWVQAANCSQGTVKITMQPNVATDQAGNLGPASVETTSPVTKKAPVAPVTDITPGTNPEPKPIATAPDRFVGPLTSQSRESLVKAGIVRAVEGTTKSDIKADFTQMNSPIANAQIAKSVTMQTGETLQASVKFASGMVTTHKVVGYMRVDSTWIDLGTTEINEEGVVTVPATFANPGNYFLRITSKQLPTQNMMSTMSFSDPIMTMPGQALEIDITVTGEAIELIAPARSSMGYGGPVLETSGQQVSSLGGEVTYRGSNLQSVDEIVVSGVTMTIIAQSDDEITIEISALEPGEYSLDLVTGNGQITVLGALIVYLEINLESQEAEFVTKRISDNEVKVYAKHVTGIGKVQFMVNGQEIAWVRTDDPQHAKLRRVILNGKEVSYLVRTLIVDRQVEIDIKLNGVTEHTAIYSPSSS